MECGANYPKEPPVIHFVSQINLPGVSQTDGRVDPNYVGILRDWTRISAELSRNPRPKEDPLSLEAALIAIRKYVEPEITAIRTEENRKALTMRHCRYMEEHKKLPQPPEGSKYPMYK